MQMIGPKMSNIITKMPTKKSPDEGAAPLPLRRISSSRLSKYTERASNPRLQLRRLELYPIELSVPDFLIIP